MDDGNICHSVILGLNACVMGFLIFTDSIGLAKQGVRDQYDTHLIIICSDIPYTHYILSRKTMTYTPLEESTEDEWSLYTARTLKSSHTDKVQSVTGMVSKSYLNHWGST